MRYVELQGTPRQIGHRHGAAFADLIRKYHDFYCRRLVSRTINDLDRSVLRYLECKCSYLLEEMEGIATGSGMSFDDILVYNHFNAMTGCTPVFFADTEVGPILGQNIDCGEQERAAMLVRLVRPTNGHAFITTTFVGCVWSTNGLNQAGLCHGNCFCYFDGMSAADGTSTGIIKRDMLQYAANVEDALEIARSHRHIGKIGIWILVDASGNALRLEQTNDLSFTFPPTDGLLFSTGIYEAPIPLPSAPLKSLEFGKARRRTIEQLHRQGQIAFSVAGMQKLLAHHCSPGPVCRHPPYEQNKDATRSTRIMIPAQGRYLVTDGPSCRNSFHEYRLCQPL